MDNYHVIAGTIEYLKENDSGILNIPEVAEKLNLSVSHINAAFMNWAGTSPSSFFHYLSKEYIFDKLKIVPEQPTLFDLTDGENKIRTFAHSGFCDIIRMDDEDISRLKQDGAKYFFFETPFGRLLAASTDKGVCYMAFCNEEEKAMEAMRKKLGAVISTFTEGNDEFQNNAISIFEAKDDYPFRIKLHLKGTDFQFHVWNELLKVPFGELTTYHEMAIRIGQPKAYRATGSAIARNWIAYILPCHRVIQSGGNIGQYMWGSTRKNAIIGWEAAILNRGAHQLSS